MIACSQCGWVAVVARGEESKPWEQHVRANPSCADAEPLIRYPHPRRARLCIHGHQRDALGDCPTCAANRGGS